VRGAGAGAGAAVAAVAVHAALGLAPASWRHTRSRVRWVVYLLAGGAAAATLGPWLVLVLLGCGALELAWRRRALVAPAASVPASGGLLALAWTSLKVGALSFGGGFVIVPLMRADAVDHYHWLTREQFLNAVALGQITPGPVVQTVAAVGYGAAGIGGGLLAALVAFLPSFAFVLLGAGRFDRLRGNASAQAFLDGGGPAAIGAILGVAVPLVRDLGPAWQYGVLGGAAFLLVGLRRGVVTTLILAGAAGVVVALVGGALPR
jgi:chromate transporter